MILGVVRRRAGRSAVQLVEALWAAGYESSLNPPVADDVVTIGWGSPRCVINARAGSYDKRVEILTLARAGVAVPEVWGTAPHHTAQNPPESEITSGLWLPRTRHHRRATDLLRPQWARCNVSFWTRRLRLTQEFRCHVIRSHRSTDRFLVVRSGQKILPVQAPSRHSETSSGERMGYTDSTTWVRSRQSGWNVSYDGVSTSEEMRSLAKSAVAALGLDFGAVDLGVTEEGRVVVLEVNTAPSLDNPNTAACYAERLGKLAKVMYERGETNEGTERSAP